MNIGKLTPADRPNAANSEYQGYIRTLILDLAIRLIANLDKRNDRAPDYVVEALGRIGQWVSVGAAWWKESTREDGSLNRYLSITIADPSIPEVLHCAAFLEDSGNTWLINWRPRKAPSPKTPRLNLQRLNQCSHPLLA
jgi:uncharacterized protein (DUF736 family)